LAKILIRLKNLLTVFLTDNPDPKASPILISLTSFTAEMSERNVRGGGEFPDPALQHAYTQCLNCRDGRGWTLPS